MISVAAELLEESWHGSSGRVGWPWWYSMWGVRMQHTYAQPGRTHRGRGRGVALGLSWELALDCPWFESFKIIKKIYIIYIIIKTKYRFLTSNLSPKSTSGAFEDPFNLEIGVVIPGKGELSLPHGHCGDGWGADVAVVYAPRLCVRPAATPRAIPPPASQPAQKKSSCQGDFLLPSSVDSGRAGDYV